MISAPEDVPGWISPEFGGGVTVIGGGWPNEPGYANPLLDVGKLGPPPPMDPGLNPGALIDGSSPAANNEKAESIDSNFILIGAAVVLGVILLTSGND